MMMMDINAIKPGKPFLFRKPYLVFNEGKYHTYRCEDLLVALERVSQSAEIYGTYWRFLTQDGAIIALQEFNALTYLKEVSS